VTLMVTLLFRRTTEEKTPRPFRRRHGRHVESSTTSHVFTAFLLPDPRVFPKRFFPKRKPRDQGLSTAGQLG
jgi:hypothetical protein